MGHVDLINSGAGDLAQEVFNRRAGGMGLVSGGKAFERPMAEGANLLNAIPDVSLQMQKC